MKENMDIANLKELFLMPTPTFLGIPQECRERIYEWALADGNSEENFSHCTHRLSAELQTQRDTLRGLMLTSKRVSKEVLPTHYRTSRFSAFVHLDDLVKMREGDRALHSLKMRLNGDPQYIKQLDITVDCMWPDRRRLDRRNYCKFCVFQIFHNRKGDQYNQELLRELEAWIDHGPPGDRLLPLLPVGDSLEESLPPPGWSNAASLRGTKTAVSLPLDKVTLRFVGIDGEFEGEMAPTLDQIITKFLQTFRRNERFALKSECWVGRSQENRLDEIKFSLGRNGIGPKQGRGRPQQWGFRSPLKMGSIPQAMLKSGVPWKEINDYLKKHFGNATRPLGALRRGHLGAPFHYSDNQTPVCLEVWGHRRLGELRSGEEMKRWEKRTMEENPLANKDGYQYPV
ncbi:hypothetical protein BU16DRAFT_18698 [Lophium mytilinum]|uniref:Uncharacterized protein n=1 Tax=Lophium mytilinum TaxID=390894 RepID=A0A6A6REA9_9PEZI|nr:hypothetical protein BU16DRAFT_18698 [Lophium mytilinum]